MRIATSDLISEVNSELSRNANLATAVRSVGRRHGMKPGCIDQRIRRAGYRYQLEGRLVKVENGETKKAAAPRG